MAETIGLLIFAGVEAAGVAGAAAAGAATIGATSLTVATVVGAVATTAALVGLQYALADDEAAAVPALSKQTQTLRQPITPRQFGYGRARLTGLYVLYEETGGTSLDIIYFCEGPIVGNQQWFLDNELVTLDGDLVVDCAVSDGRYVSVPGFDFVRIQYRNGFTPELPYTGAIATLPPGLWTVNHRGDGCASAYLICSGLPPDFRKTFPHGLPQLDMLADLLPVHDPRDEAQSRYDPATWQFSTNPIWQLVDYLTSTTHGMGLNWDIAIAPKLDALKQEANLCDMATDDGAGGFEPRYSSNGKADLPGQPEAVIGLILSACDGWMCEDIDGSLSIVSGYYREPSVTLELRHIIDVALQGGVRDEDAVNELTWTFVSPAEKYKAAPGDPWRDEAAIAAQGAVRSKHLTLEWVHSHSQGRRLLKRASDRLNAPRRGTIVTTLYGLRAIGHRWVRVRWPIVTALADAVIEIQPNPEVNPTEGRVTFHWLLVNPATIENTDFGIPPTVPPYIATVTADSIVTTADNTFMTADRT